MCAPDLAHAFVDQLVRSRLARGRLKRPQAEPLSLHTALVPQQEMTPDLLSEGQTEVRPAVKFSIEIKSLFFLDTLIL